MARTLARTSTAPASQPAGAPSWFSQRLDVRVPSAAGLPGPPRGGRWGGAGRDPAPGQRRGPTPPPLRHEALRHIPNSVGRNSEGGFWVRWLTRIRKVMGTVACQKSSGRVQAYEARRCGTRVIWLKLYCLNPNLQVMQGGLCRTQFEEVERSDGAEGCGVGPLWSAVVGVHAPPG